MENDNCLEGMKCPQCGQTDRFRISAQSVFVVTDAGTEDHGDVEWGPLSDASCPECDWSGLVQGLLNPTKPMTQEEYIEQRGLQCPFCRKEDIGGHQFNVNTAVAYQEITCNNCGKAWTDVYDLVRYEPGE